MNDGSPTIYMSTGLAMDSNDRDGIETGHRELPFKFEFGCAHRLETYIDKYKSLFQHRHSSLSWADTILQCLLLAWQSALIS